MKKSSYMQKLGLWLCAIVIWLLSLAVGVDSPIAALIMLVSSAVFVPPFREDLIEYGANGKYLTIGAVIVVFSCLIFSFIDDPKVQAQVAEQKEKVKIQETVEQVEREDERQTDKAMLVTKCELAVKTQLRNPQSFNVDMHQTHVYDHEGKLVLDMFYYADNAYGATSINEVFCDFTYRGTLIDVMHA